MTTEPQAQTREQELQAEIDRLNQQLLDRQSSDNPAPCTQDVQQVRVESRHLSHREVSNQGTDAERWLPAHIRWDMSANVHPTSPTLSTEEPYVGPMCAHERQALDTDPPGRDWRFQITPA